MHQSRRAVAASSGPLSHRMNSGCRPLAEAILSSQTHMAGTPAGWWLTSWQSDGKASVAGTLSCPRRALIASTTKMAARVLKRMSRGSKTRVGSNAWKLDRGHHRGGDLGVQRSGDRRNSRWHPQRRAAARRHNRAARDAPQRHPGSGVRIHADRQRRDPHIGAGARGQPGAARGNDRQHGDAGPATRRHPGTSPSACPKSTTPNRSQHGSPSSRPSTTAQARSSCASSSATARPGSATRQCATKCST